MIGSGTPQHLLLEFPKAPLGDALAFGPRVSMKTTLREQRAIEQEASPSEPELTGVSSGVSNPMSPGGVPNDSATQTLAPIRVIAATCLPLPSPPGSLKIRPKSPDREKTEKRPRLMSYASNESGPWGSSQTGRPNSPGPEPRLPMRLVRPLPISYRMSSPSPPLTRKTASASLSRTASNTR